MQVLQQPPSRCNKYSVLQQSRGNLTRLPIRQSRRGRALDLPTTVSVQWQATALQPAGRPQPAQREMARKFIAWQAEGLDCRDIWRYLLVQRIGPVGSVRAWNPNAIRLYIKRERVLQEVEAQGITPYGNYLREGDDHA